MSESKFAERAATTKKMLGAAAQLAKKQAELATLNNVTLPKLYYAIGKAIVGQENLPPELAVHRDRIRALEAGIAAKLDEPQSTAAEGFAAKAKKFAQLAAKKAAKATADATATIQIQAAYVGLGKAGVEENVGKAIPKELTAELAVVQAARQKLTEEVNGLRQSSRGGAITPSRVLVATCTLVVVGLGLVFWGVETATLALVKQPDLPGQLKNQPR